MLKVLEVQTWGRIGQISIMLVEHKLQQIHVQHLKRDADNAGEDCCIRQS